MLKGILSLFRYSIIFGVTIIKVNILIMYEIITEKLFSLIPSGAICSLSNLAIRLSLTLFLHTF
jgi:hypothetical protein